MYTPDSSIIDNRKLKLFEELNKILQEQKVLDIASGYFNLSGFQLVKDEIRNVKKFRLLIGKVPEVDDKKIPDFFEPYQYYTGRIKTDLEDQDFKKENKTAAIDFIKFLKRPSVEVRLYDKGFLHGKAYIFEKIAITGSSNFTYSGLTSNTELNAVLDAAHAKYIREEWFQKFWKESKDFKKDLIRIYEESKFGTKEYLPYEIYIKSLYELQKDDIEALTKEEIPKELPESVVDLTTFQEDAVKRIYTRLKQYNGVLIADSVGLGKTWIAKKIIEDFGFYRRRKFLVICPAQLDDMWRKELKELGVSENIIHQEELGKENLSLPELERKHRLNLKEIALIVIDESHNFRNPLSNRYENLYSLIEKAQSQKPAPKVALMTATPMNNTLWDLYFQLMLVALNNKKIFIKDGIFNLEKEFRKAQEKADLSRLNDVLQLISIRRTRQYIQENYPEAKIKTPEGKWEKVIFPKRSLKDINYSLDQSYRGFYREIANKIEKELTMAYYVLEDYRIVGKADALELGRMKGLVGIFRTLFLKRLESSIEAFRKSIDNQIKFLHQFKKYLSEGKVLRKKFYLKYFSFFEEEIDNVVILNEVKKNLEKINLNEYNREKLFNDLERDIEIFKDIYQKVSPITTNEDTKLITLKNHLLELKDQGKIIIFSYYTDTLSYIFESLQKDRVFLKKLGKKILRIDGSFPVTKRIEIVNQFMEGDIDILFSTDILSEGQNLQKAKIIINYDLHWNPTRMIQRAGRIDRIGSPFKEISIYNFFPEKELELLLELVKALQNKISVINETIGLDASVLGETISPKVFGVILNLRGDEKTKAQTLRDLEEEQFGGGESFWQPLKNFGLEKLQEFVEKLPYAIQSGLKKNFRGIYFYYQYENDYHFWFLYDVLHKEFITNKSEILKFITCSPKEPRVIPKDINAYAINDLVKKEIQELFSRSLLEAEVRTPSGKKDKFIVDMMDEISHIKKEFLMEDDTITKEKIEIILKKLNEISFTKKRMQFLRRIWRNYKQSKNWRKFVSALNTFLKEKAIYPSEKKEEFDEKKLKLICVDYIS